jgi:hypothetical protein
MVTNFSSVTELNALNDATLRVIGDRSLRQHVVRVHVGGPTYTIRLAIGAVAQVVDASMEIQLRVSDLAEWI